MPSTIAALSTPRSAARRRIDRRGIDHVGIVERGLEVFHVIAQAGEAVRLDHRDHAATHAFARGGQHGADFHRVMAIVVDHRHFAARHGDFAHLGEAALDPAELGKAGADQIVRHAHFHRHGNRGQRVLHVVAARHRQVMSSIRWNEPSRWRSTAVKRLPPGSGVTPSPRTSAWAEKP
jgi:hypothetical protein